MKKMAMSCITSIAVIDADGEVLGVYRKTHIPDDHYYQENSISRLVTLVSRSGILAMLRLGSVSVGINGSLKQQALSCVKWC